MHELDDLLVIYPVNVELLSEHSTYVEMSREDEEYEKVNQIIKKMKERRLCEKRIRDFILNVDAAIFYPGIELLSEHYKYYEMSREDQEYEKVNKIIKKMKERRTSEKRIRDFVLSVDAAIFYPGDIELLRQPNKYDEMSREDEEYDKVIQIVRKMIKLRLNYV